MPQTPTAQRTTRYTAVTVNPDKPDARTFPYNVEAESLVSWLRNLVDEIERCPQIEIHSIEVVGFEMGYEYKTTLKAVAA